MQQKRSRERRFAFELVNPNLLERRDRELRSFLDLEILFPHVAIADGDAGLERLKVDAKRATDGARLLWRGRNLAADVLRFRLEAAADRQRAYHGYFGAGDLVLVVSPVSRADDAGQRGCREETDDTHPTHVDGHKLILRVLLEVNVERDEMVYWTVFIASCTEKVRVRPAATPVNASRMLTITVKLFDSRVCTPGVRR